MQLQDVFYHLMDRSDPIIQSYTLAFRMQRRDRNVSIPKDVLDLCVPQEP